MSRAVPCQKNMFVTAGRTLERSAELSREASLADAVPDLVPAKNAWNTQHHILSGSFGLPFLIASPDHPE